MQIEASCSVISDGLTATAKLLSSYQVWSACILILITIAESPSAQIWKCRYRQPTTLAFIAVRKETICAFLLLHGQSKYFPQVKAFRKVFPKQTIQMHEWVQTRVTFQGDPEDAVEGQEHVLFHDHIASLLSDSCTTVTSTLSSLCLSAFAEQVIRMQSAQAPVGRCPSRQSHRFFEIHSSNKRHERARTTAKERCSLRAHTAEKYGFCFQRPMGAWAGRDPPTQLDWWAVKPIASVCSFQQNLSTHETSSLWHQPTTRHMCRFRMTVQVLSHTNGQSGSCLGMQRRLKPSDGGYATRRLRRVMYMDLFRMAVLLVCKFIQAPLNNN